MKETLEAVLYYLIIAPAAALKEWSDFDREQTTVLNPDEKTYDLEDFEESW
jgi:hypothetical protein